MEAGSVRMAMRGGGWARVPDDHAYRVVRQNTTQLLTGRAGLAGRRVPACPQWTVLDLVRHLTEICGRATRRLGGTAVSCPEDDLGSLVAHWNETGRVLEGLLADGAGAVLVMDAFTHEGDLRQALDMPLPAEHAAYPTALEVLVNGFSAALLRDRLPAVRIETRGARWIAGEGVPAVVLEGHRHDLYRALAGRRTLDQIGALSWSACPDRWLSAFTWGPFRPPPTRVETAVAEL